MDLYLFILNDKHEVVPVKDLKVWARWYEDTDERQVDSTMVGETEISTVFLGLDHSHDAARPLFFETMVFGGPLDQDQWRCSTWDEAVAQHRDVVAQVKRKQLFRVVK